MHQSWEDLMAEHVKKLTDLENKVQPLLQIIPKIDEHIDEEDRNKAHFKGIFKAGEERMDKIEGNITNLNKLVDIFEGFSKSIRIIMYLGGVILAMFIWILFQKNDEIISISHDIKAVQATLVPITVSLEKTIQAHQELEKDFRRDTARIERDIESLHPKHKK